MRPGSSARSCPHMYRNLNNRMAARYRLPSLLGVRLACERAFRLSVDLNTVAFQSLTVLCLSLRSGTKLLPFSTPDAADRQVLPMCRQYWPVMPPRRSAVAPSKSRGSSSTDKLYLKL